MHKLKQWYQDLNLQSKFTLVLLLIVSIPGIAIIFFFYGRAYDMVVSYTIRQELPYLCNKPTQSGHFS